MTINEYVYKYIYMYMCIYEYTHIYLYIYIYIVLMSTNNDETIISCYLEKIKDAHICK
jgi:hypothetical protein